MVNQYSDDQSHVYKLCLSLGSNGRGPQKQKKMIFNLFVLLIWILEDNISEFNSYYCHWPSLMKFEKLMSVTSKHKGNARLKYNAS